MELKIVDGDSLISGGLAGLAWFLLHEELIIHAELALGHSRQLALNLD
jgi:hypothetical protein